MAEPKNPDEQYEFFMELRELDCVFLRTLIRERGPAQHAIGLHQEALLSVSKHRPELGEALRTLLGRLGAGTSKPNDLVDLVDQLYSVKPHLLMVYEFLQEKTWLETPPFNKERRGRFDRWLRDLRTQRAAVEKHRNWFAAKNDRLAYYFSRSQIGRDPHNTMDDVWQEGRVGLLIAVEKYDVRMGIQFSTYAQHWISHHTRRVVANKGRTVRLPVHLQEHIAALYKRRVQILEGANPKDHQEELDEAAKESPDGRRLPPPSTFLGTVVQSSYNHSILSTHALVPGTDNVTLEERLVDEEATDATDEILATQRAAVATRLMALLEPKEQEILKWRFGMGRAEKTLKEIGKIFGVSRERIRQIEAKALLKLRTRTPWQKENAWVDAEAESP